MNHRVQVFNEKDNIQFNFGSKGKSAGKFNYPVGVGINQVNGNIAIADSYNNRIQVFNNKCEYLFHFRSQENEGELICPTEVVFDGNSNFFVIDHTNQIKVFDPHGNFMYKFRSGQYMSSIAINRWERRIIISDYDSDKVKVFDQRGNFIFKFGSCGVQEGQSNGPVAIAVTEGLIVVADSGNNRVQVFDNRGQFVCMFGSEGIGNGQFKNICGVAADGQGRIITTDAVCGVQIFEPNY
jgi:DNA-binding beta-propeller fold protein YncE